MKKTNVAAILFISSLVTCVLPCAVYSQNGVEKSEKSANELLFEVQRNIASLESLQVRVLVATNSDKGQYFEERTIVLSRPGMLHIKFGADTNSEAIMVDGRLLRLFHKDQKYSLQAGGKDDLLNKDINGLFPGLSVILALNSDDLLDSYEVKSLNDSIVAGINVSIFDLRSTQGERKEFLVFVDKDRRRILKVIEHIDIPHGDHIHSSVVTTVVMSLLPYTPKKEHDFSLDIPDGYTMRALQKPSQHLLGFIGRKIQDAKLLSVKKMAYTRLSTIMAGKPAIVEFWASWCGSCLKLMPYLEYLRGDERLNIISISGDDAAGINAFLNDHGYSHDVFLESKDGLADYYSIIGYPTMFAVDAEGNIKAIEIGFNGVSQLASLLQTLEIPVDDGMVGLAF